MLSVDFIGPQYDLTDSFWNRVKYAMIRLFGSYVFDQSRQCLAILPIVGFFTEE
jgi:hypothetical protein